MQKKLSPKLNWAERVSYLMDEKFRIPGTNFRFGIDPLLNLIPVLGDISGFAVSIVLVLTMARHGLSRKVLILMFLNVILDSTIGAIPIIGHVFDFVYKSNSRNIRLLKEYYEEGKHQGSARGTILWIVLFLIVFILIFVWLMWKILELIIDLF
ncbi:MAG: hypothetical protein B7X86_10760 [Sphingobacteriales bacterium 17-39-43]|jgi:hypothetical protein|uniref:DUF4112 domain-containing protein n=1 Tax=Daejeonella sp. TaxID=2805397 RepID=UPI000BD0EC13|nr:DUF4112 domain-containing protein [Daejeonella sp.]OYZ31111.1 MAG: hypothetical protein B7Y24_10700 [Sphingobacteriales bacterium 16-39-50]OYZ58290.1 MAG: hypothetical protein B7Y19_02080 [Sphingobacteriales bacterium 24-40-4]OZA23952.1 MAG: hypothetical protein B7X86_10760 [Sphingobacteriales bacterium 17-39-43]HQS04246.1 DUF4112 domain-containing protein [Daejeonella sp.]HQT23293.1 DUF4112 domain-containing protein [Daejeonella sp.]